MVEEKIVIDISAFYDICVYYLFWSIVILINERSLDNTFTISFLNILLMAEKRSLNSSIYYPNEFLDCEKTRVIVRLNIIERNNSFLLLLLLPFQPVQRILLLLSSVYL
jgi:hypothetical protein